ncbi:ubiquitin carboxyl-terminal hydrolase [Trifolium medium]|uniref:Ubiquitin carboxyl-terminal hydrolase n=1 Tax=Trifolium medium TaxID=97028 RepID=A0A392PAJ1_9FABA|nr:ubiquitin carboxyl-terminal hydrolase [Trifolium medium]
MVGNKNWLYEFDGEYRDFVKLGDDSRMSVMGRGDLKLSINGRTHIITSVYYIPVSKASRSQLWHDRYAHLSIKGLNTLSKMNMVKGLPTLDDLEDKCADCLIGKQHRDSIPKQATWRASSKLELVHSDICGPINPMSNGGNSNG